MRQTDSPDDGQYRACDRLPQDIDRRQQDKRDIAKADEEVLKRVLCGATDAKDFEYLTERLKQVTP